jgi:autotransporter-associated beta strand protein
VGTFGGGTLELTGSNSFNGGVQVKIGSLLVGNDYALGTGTLTVTSQNKGASNTATAAFAGSVQLESNLNNTAVVAGGISMSQLATDTVGNANPASLAPSLDLGGSNMVLEYTGSSPIATIQSYLHSGWIKTSAAGEVVGYGEASAAYPTGGSFYNAPLDGVTPALLLKTTYAGDANLDGTVNALDFNALATNFGSSGQYWMAGDFDNNGTVDSNDFSLLAANYGKVVPTSAAPAASLGALVPEPGTIALLGFAAALGLRRRSVLR